MSLNMKICLFHFLYITPGNISIYNIHTIETIYYLTRSDIHFR